MATSDLRVTTPGDRRIVMTRVFDAARADVFDAWTQPDQVAAWWDPSGAPLAACEIDLRPGGAFRWAHDGPQPAFSGVYRAIESPGRLVFTVHSMTGGEDMHTELLFAEHDGRTTMTMTIDCGSARDRAALLAVRVDVGTAMTMDNLAAHLRRGGPAR